MCLDVADLHKAGTVSVPCMIALAERCCQIVTNTSSAARFDDRAVFCLEQIDMQVMIIEYIINRRDLRRQQEQTEKQILFDGTVPLVQNDPQRFSGRGLLWNGHTWQDYVPTSEEYGPALYYTLSFSTASAPAGLVYTRTTAPNGNSAYALVPKGTQGEEATFRTLNPLHTLKSDDVTKLIASLLGVTPLWTIVLWTLPVMLAFALTSTLYPLWQIWHIRPAELVRSGSSVSSGTSSRAGSRFVGGLMPIGSLVLHNVSRSRTRALLAVLSLFFSALLLMVMFNSLLAQHQALQGTLLGDYVLLQTAVPQIAGCVIALVLTFLSVADLLLLQVRERQKEIGLFHAIGWRPWAIQRLFAQEGLLLAIGGTIPGVLVSLWILSSQHVVQHIASVPLIACGVVVLMLLVAILAILPAMRAVSRMRVVDLLRAE